MSTTGTVVEVTGEVWARGADGSLRRLSAGDELTGTETLILAAGAALVVRSGSGADAELVTLEGAESGFLIVPPDQTEPFLASPDLVRMIEENLLAENRPEEQPEQDPAPRLGDGHRFVQLVRIEDQLETDSIAPLNLARNREVLRPMTIDWADPVEEELEQRYSSGRNDEQPVNRAPVLAPDTRTIQEDETASGNVLDNDSDPENRVLTVTQFEIGGQVFAAGEQATIAGIGAVLINADGSYSFTPVPDWSGTVPTVTYTVDDGRGSIGTSTLDIVVEPVSDIVPDAITTQSGDPVTVDVLDNDTFENSNAAVTAISQGGHGTVVINPDGTITYTPDPGYVGPDSYTYTVTSGGGTETTTVTVEVTNEPPAPLPETETTAEDTPLSGNVLENDVDPNGHPLAVTAFEIGGQAYTAGQTATIPGVGTLVIGPDGAYTFVPEKDWNGTVPTVTYTVSDGNDGGTATSTLDILVTPVNDPPVTTPLPGQSDSDADPVSGVDVKAGFSDPESDVLTYTATGLPPGLVLDPVTGLIGGTIDNSASQSGTAGNPPGVYTVVVTADDGNGGTVRQSFEWTVTNPAPEAIDDSGTTDENTALVVSAAGGVLGNDRDPDGDTLTVSAVNGASASVGSTVAGTGGGRFTLNADGSYAFTPNGEFDDLAVGETRTTSVTYTISDGEGGTDTATLLVTVTGTHDGPVAVGTLPGQSNEDADTVVSIDVTAAFADVDASDTLTYTATGLPPGLTLDPVTGRISGTIDNSASQSGTAGNPPGTYTVVVTADDGHGGTVSQSFDWTVSNPVPEAIDDAGTTDENTALVVSAAGGVLGNDSDPDGDALTVSAVNGIAAGVGSSVVGSSGGAFILGADGSYTFDPNGEFDDLAVGETRTTSVTYTISDGEGGTDTATLVVTVTGTNDGPVAVGMLPAQANEDAETVVTIDVTSAFADIDASDTLTYTATELPPGLTLDPVTGLIGGTIDNSASQSGTTGNPPGVYTVVVTADDGNGGTVSQSFDWTVSNPVPVALDDARTTDEDTPLSATAANGLLGNDSDPDRDVLVVSEVNGAPGNVGAAVAGNGGGTFILNADGSYTFDPNGEFDDLSVGETRTTSVTYTIDDGEGGSDTATFEVTVTGINDPPVAADDVDATDEATPLAVDAADGVLGNDSDPEGDPLTVSAINGAAAGVGSLLAGTGGGTFTLNADGSYAFDPNGEFEDLAVGETRTTSVTYTISDGEGGTDTATLTVTVTGTNDGPVEVGTLPGQANEDADAVVTVDIASAFTDADTSDTLTYTATGLPPGLTLDPVTGIISGTIDNSASQSSTGGNPAGVYTVVVTADDGHGSTVTQSFDWTVTNPAPQAAADNGTVTEDGPDLVVSAANGVIASGAAVAGMDIDPDGDALSVTHVMAGTAAHLGDFPGTPNAGTQIVGTYGTLTIAADGSYTYVLDNANPLVNGLDAVSAPLSDVFSYAISDGEGGTSFTTLTITINGNDDGAPSITPTDTNGIDPGQLTVYEAGLTADGPIGHTADASGSIVISAGNGLVGIAIGATALTLAQLEAITSGSPIVIDTPQGRLTLTGYASSGEIGGVSTGGTLSYTYTLEDTVTNPDPASDGSNEVIELSVEDAAGRTNTADFAINIVDDVPTSGAPDPATVDEANLTGGTDTNPGALTVTGSLDIRAGADDGSLDTVFDAAQAGLAGLTSNGIPLDYEISLDGHTLTATAGPGGAVVFTATLTNSNSPAAAYSFVLSGPLDHGASPLDLSFAFTVTDADGDSDTNSFQVTVLDDGPIAVDQAGLFLEEGGAVVGSASGGANLLGNDTAGADGSAKVSSITYTDESGSSATAAVPLGGVTVDTRYGSLTVNPDGTWSYTSDATEDNAAGVAESFSYTVEDYDGSTSSAVQPLTVTDTDPTPGVVSLGIDEQDVPGAGSAGSPTNSVTENMGIVKGPDAIEDVVFDASTVSGLEAQNLTSGGTPLVYTLSGDGHVLTATGPGGAVVFTLTLDNPADPSGASQSITMALTGRLDHPAANGENALSIPVGYTLHDTDSSVTATLELKVVDDVPTAQAGPVANVVEGGQTVVGTPLLANDIQGADGARLYQVQYTNEAGGLTVATVAAGPGGSTFDTIHGSLTVRQDGTWSYTSDPVVSSGTSVSHPQPGSDLSVDEIFSYNLIDGDGDVSGWANQTVTVNDTIPSIGSPEAEVVSEANLPSGSDSDVPALTRTGSLDVTKAADGVDVTFAAVQAALENLALTSGGVALVYTIGAGGHTLTATANGSAVFTATIVNPTSASASYSFVLSRPLDHTGGSAIELPIAFGVTDGDGDTDDGNFAITVTDDEPQTEREFTLDEDSAGITFNTSADATGSNVSTSDPANGTATVNANGTITYVPDANFSGTDTFTYTTVADDGSNVVTTVTITVSPISDAPQVPVDAGAVLTDEDEAVGLGLNAPVVTDAVDQNGAGAGDNPELLGAITLTGIPNDAQILDGSGNLLFTSTGAPITIQLSDGPHIQGITSDLTMTAATYEGLRVLPPAESHANFMIAVSVTSYEVDDAGNPLAGVPGATSSANVTVNVQAVTDPITLALVDGGDPDTSATDHTFAEDSTFDLADLLSVGFPSTDGNGGADVDGSEVRWFEIAGLPLGTTVNGVMVTAGNPIATVAAPGLSTSSTGLPAMTIRPPANFSGDVSITVTLNARDGDADGVGSGATTGGLVQESVVLDLHVTPVGGDVAASGVTVAEDAAAAFLSGIRVTDEGGNGTELITQVQFGVPAGWTVSDTGAGTGYTASLVDTTYTIVFDGSLTEAQREAVLDGFRIEGPAHSSADVTIDVAVTTADTVSIDGGNVTDTTTRTLPVTVTVTPVAELVGGDSDGDGNADAAMTAGHVYATAGEEDAWFTLGTEGGFNLGTGWSNQDINEQVFARLTPELISGDGGADNAIGAQFRYSTNGDTSEGGGAWVTVTYAGTPVDIPVAYLNTLQFKAPEDLSGTFEIDVQTLTRDTDLDTGATVQAVSGSAVLSNLVIEPAADEVTVALNARANGIEDTAISLDIRPTSSDPSETFTVTIADIPAGAQLFYDGVLQTLTAGSVTIEEFDSTKPLTLQPPLNSNADFTLSVSAFSVDGADISGTQTLGVNVSLKGVADVATVTVLGASYSEAALDSGSDQVLLSELISTTLHDDDTSEVLTLRVTGLPQGSSLSEGTMLVGGTGAERVWVLTQQQFATVRVSTPANYSGTQTFSVTPVTTENDGDSRTGAPQTVSIVVTPSTEAAVTTSATLDEDTLTPLGLAIVHQNGDTDETLTTVWIAESDAVSAGFSLYLGSTLLGGAGLPTANIDGQNYYVLTGSQIAQLSAKGAANLDGSLGSFDFKYEITDQSFGGTPAGATTTTVHDGVFQLTADPVTDPIDVSIPAIAGTGGITTTTDEHAGDDAAPDTASLTAGDLVTVTLNIAPVPDAGSAGGTADDDGSEKVIRVVIEGVPDGVSVQGAEYSGAGTWLLIYNDVTALPIDDAGGISLPIVFDVSGFAGGLDDVPITIQVQSQDGDQDAGTAILSDSVTWRLSTNFAPGEGALPGLIDQWAYNGAHAAEDTVFALSDVIDAQVTVRDATVSNVFTVSLTDLPAGTIIDGMTMTVVNGVEVWTASVTVPAGGDANAALGNLLDSIGITAPEHSNENNAAGSFHFDARLTVSVPNGGNARADLNDMTVPVDPVTDAGVITIVADAIDEGMATIPVTITVTNDADGAFGGIVGGTLYVKVDAAGSTNGLENGTLTYNGAEMATEVIGGELYYVVTGVTAGTPVELVYTPDNSTAGEVSFSALVRTQENGSAVIQTGTGSGTAQVIMINNGVTVGSAPSSGTESSQVSITGLVVALVDNDGSETIKSILLSNVPNGFLVYVGDTVGTATLASNAGGDNTWVISNPDGSLPDYVAILPPEHWSGTLDSLTVTVESGETAFSDGIIQNFDLGDVTITAVADGVDLTATNTFGPENQIIPLNLNASMADPTDASVPGAADASQETTTLRLTGLGEFASFYIGAAQKVTGLSYDAVTDTYTLTGLTQSDLDQLGFLQARNALTDQDATSSGIQIAVEAFTSDDASISASDSAFLTVNSFAQLATSGNDSLLWTGSAIDAGAGTDTLRLRHGEDLSGSELDSRLSNVEVLDLHGNSVDSLSATDVLGIAGSTSVLSILGDGADSLTLADGWAAAGTQQIGGIEYAIYTATVGMTDVELHVQSGITVD
ncbi:tandem-95 repeat protein [Altererythrobacter soli]|uniref:Tandem-95 repeat protein n=1 Tax=Croceibacterium soli TaxID=1739690 RepID=A0A6I4UWX8_9SPHN|nr:Ig-like domain-containing protein [Croceibacterium soli]MXP41917.1 tandem-95 repeat protein [Croceibacterium soli]